ncbi:hypothetical protein [Thermodesulforhabdus norvegica]|uniref:Uncharacterized protein n=1 Tax=Thermodesulforhabdus norvegica TaxID=39841 RepID=A0A1I4VDZ8_9BACT|nr:hypothetical protein [Thermodesulforhabdus norvegica]SFM99417.1 hypothetical protein SAMN05660836_02243 [Thermodesulforhabdus norvegica]
MEGPSMNTPVTPETKGQGCRFVIKNFYEMLIDDNRSLLAVVMTAQQNPKRVRWLLHDFRRDFEHMTKDELLRYAVVEPFCVCFI